MRVRISCFSGDKSFLVDQNRLFWCHFARFDQFSAVRGKKRIKTNSDPRKPKIWSNQSQIWACNGLFLTKNSPISLQNTDSRSNSSPVGPKIKSFGQLHYLCCFIDFFFVFFVFVVVFSVFSSHSSWFLLFFIWFNIPFFTKYLSRLLL